MRPRSRSRLRSQANGSPVMRLKRYGASSTNIDAPRGRGQIQRRYALRLMIGRAIVVAKYHRPRVVTTLRLSAA